MRPIVKEAAEMYALKCISSPQLMEVCDSVQEILESLEYASEYAAQYGLHVEMEKRKHDEMQRDWIEMHYKTINRYADYTNKIIAAFYSQYLKFAQDSTLNDILRDEELRDQFWYIASTAELNLTRGSIKRIAKEARKRNTLMRVIIEFFKKYHLNECEIDYFWYYYHVHKI